MNKLLILMTLISFQSYGQMEIAHEEPEGHEHSTPFTPEEEENFFRDLETGSNSRQKGIFPTTSWNECTNRKVTGNYINYRCTRQRKISNILLEFMRENFEVCVDKAAKSNNWRMTDFHIVHKGIFGDANHSPRSLHAPGRAIDIADIIVKTPSGEKKMNFKKYGNGEFFRTFRKCWGETVTTQNECPSYRGKVSWTGSIGKEDRNHQKHLHVSVPYCINGSHAGNYFWR